MQLRPKEKLKAKRLHARRQQGSTRKRLLSKSSRGLVADRGSYYYGKALYGSALSSAACLSFRDDGRQVLRLGLTPVQKGG